MMLYPFKGAGRMKGGITDELMIYFFRIADIIFYRICKRRRNGTDAENFEKLLLIGLGKITEQRIAIYKVVGPVFG